MTASLILQKRGFFALTRWAVLTIPVIAVLNVCLPAALHNQPAAAQESAPCRVVSRIFDVDPDKEFARQKLELRRCEKHTFLLTLEAGQYVRLTLWLHGIDATMTAFAPDGALLDRISEPRMIEGKKSVWFVTKTSGRYRLEVEAAGEIAAGRYDVHTGRQISANEANQNFIRIDQGINEGVHLQEIGTEKALRQAIPLLTEIADLAAGNESWPDKDLVGGAKWFRATPLMYLGEICLSLGEFDDALKFFNRALVVEGWGDSGWTLRGIGDVYNAFGDKQRALDYYLRSLPAFEVTYSGTSSQRGPAIAKVAIGALYTSLGDYEQALGYLDQALRHWRHDGEIRGEADTLMQISEVYVRLGRYRDALDNYGQALRVYRSTSNHLRAGRTLCAAARVRITLGEYGEALAVLDESLRSAREAGDRLGQADALAEMGRAYNLTASNEKALDHLRASLEIYRSIHAAYGEAGSLFLVARVERDSGNFPEALRHIKAAIERIEATRIGLTDEQLRTSYLASVRDYFDLYVDVFMRMHRESPGAGYDREALRISERARARSLVDSLGGILNGLAGADSALIARRWNLWQRIRSRIERRPAEPGVPYIDWFNEIEKLRVEYEQIEEQIRSANHRYAALTQPRTLNAGEIQGQLDDETLLLEYALGDENSYLWVVSSAAVVSHRLPKRSEIERSARRVYDLLTARNRHRRGESRAQFAARIARADAAYYSAAAKLSRMILGPAAAQLGVKRLVIVAEGALQFIPFATLPKPSPGMRQRRPLIVDHEIVNLPSASVLTLLREEATSRQPAPKSVAVIADPVFTVDDPRVLAINKAGGHAGKDSTGNVGRSDSAIRDRSSGVTQIKPDLERAFEDLNESTMSSRLPRLFSTRWESEKIMSYAPETSFQALDFEASRETAMSDKLREYRIVHFASHAVIDDVHPELSGLVLSMVDEQGRPRDGYLRTGDIYNLKLSADLVVLSACRTGLGKDVRGEGLIGLTRGFMYAGAPRVVVSLWRVHDQATADLMAGLYSHMFSGGGSRPGARHRHPTAVRDEQPASTASALRSAQLEMLKIHRWRSPYYWAGFTLQGEWH